MSFYQDDIAGMLSDFGETLYVPGGNAINAIFQNEYEAQYVYGVEIDSSAPVAVCKSSDVSHVQVGSMINRDSNTYYVQSIQSDGTGVTVLVLSEDK